MNAPGVIRPDDWNLPLFLHVLAAMLLVGALVLAIAYLAPAWRGGSARTLSLGFRSLLYAALPAFIVMRVTAQWITDKEDLIDEPPAWIDIGFMTTDIGALFLIVALVVSGLAVRRLRRAGEEGGGASVRVATTLVSILLVAYLVAIWAMTTKPD